MFNPFHCQFHPLVITGAWRDTSTDKIYEELGWENLTNRRWYCRLCLFFLIANNQAPMYLCNVISPSLPIWCRNQHDNPNGTDNKNGNRFNFSDYFFTSCIVYWNELDGKYFQTSLVKFVRPPESNTFKILENIGLKYLTQLRVGLNDLNRYKFDHNFGDTIDPMCSVNDGVEYVTHFLLPCHLYTHGRIDLLNSVSRITETNVADLENEALVKFLLYGNEKKYSFDTNRMILLSTIIFIKNSNRF